MNERDPYDYADATPAPDDAALRRVADLAAEQLAAEAAVAAAEAELDRATARLRRVREADLPEAMSAAGVDGFKLTDGSAVTIRRDWVVSVARVNAAAAHAWLRERGLGDVIKDEIKLRFGRGQEEQAANLLTWARAHLSNVDLDEKESVHPQTLKATIKEQLRQHVDVPVALFGLMPLVIAVVTKPKSAGL